MKHTRLATRLTCLLGIFASFMTLGVTAAEGTPGAGSAAAPAAPAAGAPAPAPATPAPAAGAPAPAAAAPAAPTSSLRDIVRASLAAVKGGKAPAEALATLTAERDAAVQRADKADADLTTAQASVKSLGAQQTAFCALLGISAADLAGKDAAGISTLFKARLQSAVTEELGTLGFPAKDLPAASSTATGTGDSIEDLRTQINAETDPAKKGQLVAKLNKVKAAAKKA